MENLFSECHFENVTEIEAMGNKSDSFEIAPMWTMYNDGVHLSVKRSDISKSGNSALVTLIDSFDPWAPLPQYAKKPALTYRLDYNKVMACRGKELIFAMYVKSTVPGFVRLSIRDDKSVSYGDYHSGNDKWEILMVNHTLDANANNVWISVLFEPKPGMAYIDEGMLALASEFVNPEEAQPATVAPVIETATAIVKEVIVESKIEPTPANVQAVVSETVKEIESQPAVPIPQQVNEAAAVVAQVITEQKIEPTSANVQAVVSETVSAMESQPVQAETSKTTIDLSSLSNYAQQLVNAGVKPEEAADIVVKNALSDTEIADMSEKIEKLKAQGMTEEEAVGKVVGEATKSSKYVPWAVGIAILGAIGVYILQKKKK